MRFQLDNSEFVSEELILNPIAYGVLQLCQLWGWNFYPKPQNTMLRLRD